ncbi:MAG TPA: alpha/beta fold hydrolase [Solirubrobacteraceae bacterium]|nr:alpha/beta fold hydrolase [Solirubrobacteraceae bacterium]
MTVLCCSLLSLVAPAAASALNVSGTWNANYHCEVGWCAGQDFPAPGVVFEQAKGSSVVTSPCGCIKGTVSGNVLTIDGEEGSYTYHEVLTFAPDGKSWSGSLTDSHETSGTDTGVKVSGPEEASVSGAVEDQNDKAAPGVTVKLTGTSDTEEKAVSLNATTNSAGNYSFEVEPGNYSVTVSGEPTDQHGGVLSVRKSPVGAHEPECPGTAKEATCTLKHLEGGESAHPNFTYTQCAAPARTTEGKEPTGCPIIFVPGILGSRVFCNAGELFLSIKGLGGYFELMQLEADGETNHGPPGSCGATAYVPKGEEGLLKTVGKEDFYGGIYDYLKSIAKNGIYAFPYDWRRGVPVASKGLASLVDEALEQTGAKHVVIVAHSMGGLVTEQYLVESGGEKVSRVVTVGTPYWGAPKANISLMNGLSNAFVAETADHILFDTKELQLAARNFTGLYWLYPSAAFGPWLRVSGAKGVPSGEVGGSGVGSWVTALGGNAALLDKAEAGHASLDGFKPGDVDYQIVVGTGVPTIVKMKVDVNELEPEQWVSATYASGDGTVPARSQTQGAFPGHESGPVKIHYICGIGHASEPGSSNFKGKIEDFVLAGGEIGGPDEDCRYGGDEIVVYKTKILAFGKASTVSAPSGAAMSVQEAVSEGLIQFLELGGRTVIVTNERKPVTLTLSGKNLSLRVRSIDNNGGGAPVYYGPVSGGITIAGSTVARGSHKLKPVKSSGAPHAVARVRRHGKRFLVRLLLTGRHSAGSSIRYRIGKGAPRTYGKPLLLTRAQLKALRFAGVSSFGVFQKAQRAR